MSYDTREHLFANNASARLANALDAVATSFALESGQGALFPSPVGQQIFILTIETNAGDREIVFCTSRTGDTLTVERGREDTIAQSFPAGTVVQLRITAGTLHYLQFLLAV